MSQKRMDKIANGASHTFINLPEEFLASLPKDCWSKAQQYLIKRHRLRATRLGWWEWRARLQAHRTRLGKFYVTGAYKTPPPMSNESVEQHKFEVCSLIPL